MKGLPRRFIASCGGTGLARSRKGLAGIEFALLAPLVVTLLAGLYDTTTAYIAFSRVNTCAQTIDLIATTLASASTKPNSLTLTQATSAASAAYAYLPYVLTGSPPAFSVTLSSVVMTPTVVGCTSSCTYTAHVAWSGVYAGSGGTKRPCDLVVGTSAMTQTTDTAAPSSTTLPSDVYSAASLLVVDVSYKYTPLFFQFITSSFTLFQTAYFPPRSGLSGAWIQYVYSAPDSTTLCTGYASA